MAQALEGLDERDRQVMIIRFGMADGKVKTIAEVASHFNVPTEEIRQIERNALARRKSTRANPVEGE